MANADSTNEEGINNSHLTYDVFETRAQIRSASCLLKYVETHWELDFELEDTLRDVGMILFDVENKLSKLAKNTDEVETGLMIANKKLNDLATAQS